LLLVVLLLYLRSFWEGPSVEPFTLWRLGMGGVEVIAKKLCNEVAPKLASRR